MQIHLEPRVVVRALKMLERGAAAHALHENANEVEADACAAGFGAFFEERSGRREDRLGRATVIAHAEDDFAGSIPATDVDAERIALGVPDAVVEQVTEDDLERGRVGENPGFADGALRVDLTLERRAPRSQDLADGLGEIERLGQDGAAAFDPGEFQGAIDLGFKAGGVVEKSFQQRADVGILVIEVGNGFGLEADAGERRAEFVGDGGEECLKGACASRVPPVEVPDHGNAEEEGGEECGSLPEQHALRPNPLSLGGGVGDAELFLEAGDFSCLGQHQVDPPRAERDDERQPERLKCGQNDLRRRSPMPVGVGP